MPFLRSFQAGALALAALFACAPVSALDKQGSAHGGKVGGNATGFGISGMGVLGVSLYNPSYAARPDNSGLTLFRYAAHVDFDLIGRLLSIPLDLNLFTDRLKGGAAMLRPSEFDVITGVTSSFRAGPGAIELGARVERDMPVDQRGRTQTYADLRARYLLSLAELRPGAARALHDGDISGYVTLGWFAFNPSYAARPDNSGLALFRYVAHWQVSAFHNHLAFGLDTTFFTDRLTRPLAPSELDVTPEVIVRFDPVEVHLAYEHDTPLTRLGTLQQSMLYALVGVGFELRRHAGELRGR
jgi:hypothetical protein